MAEQNSATALRDARDARATAQAELQTARENLEQIKKALTTLEAEKRPIREQRDRNEAELQRLDGQLGERRREEESIAAEVQRQNEQTDRIRGAEGRRDERAQAESRLAALTIQLDQLQNKIAGLEILRRQARDRQTELDAHLQELDGRIAEKNQERNSAEEKVKSKEKDLSDKANIVAKKGRTVRVEAVIDPLRYLKTWIGELNSLLQAFGAAGVFYAYTLMAGFVHESWLYCSNGLRVADYTVLSDFVLVWPVLWGLLLTPVIVLLLSLPLAIPWVSELIARSLCSPLVERPVLRRFVIGLGMVVLSLIGPGAAGYGIYNGVFATPGNNEDTVTVLTDPPLEEAGALMLVGSNSTYMFFKFSSGTEEDSSGVKAIPLTRIVCVGKDCKAAAVESSKKTVSHNLKTPEGGEAPSALLDTVRDATKAVQSIARWMNPDGAPTRFEKAVVEELGEIGVKIEALTPRDPAGYSDYVAERLLPQFIGEQMRCEERTEPVLSDLIRFVNDEPYPLCPACSADATSAAGSGDGNAKQEALNKFYREKIRPKVRRIVAEFSKKSPTRWTVFGFASPDGEEGKNDLLSKNRARIVIDEMCRLKENSNPEIDCGEKKYEARQVLHFGEWHPINGISNSRSAVIAACVRDTNG